MANNVDADSRIGCGDVAELASNLSPGSREAQFLEAAVSEVSRTTSASSMSDKGSEEDPTWWEPSAKSSEQPLLPSCSSAKRSDEWSFPEFDLSKMKLTAEDTWWAPIAADTVRLAEDLAQGGLPVPASWRVTNFDPKRVWKKFRRYRHFLLFVTAVTVINGIFSILLLECLFGTSKVCMFGSCHTPHYVPASSFAYDRSTLNQSIPTPFTLPASTSASRNVPVYTDADDEAFLNEVSLEWDVNPHPSVPRAYTLQKKQGHYKALLVQDICYLYMQGTGSDHGKATGVWFDADAIEAVRAGDTRGVLDARELQKLDLIDLLVEPEDNGEGTVHKGAFRYSPDYFKAQKRVNRTVGSLVGPRGLAEYIHLSSATATRRLKRAENLRPSLVGLVGGFESNIASFSSNSVFLSEVVSPSAALLKEAVVFFPGDRKVFSQWTEGALKASVGAESSAVAGQKQGQPFCFRNAVFVLNERPAAAVEIDNFRQKAWGIADSAVSFFRRSEPLLSLGSVQKVLSTAGDDVKLQLGFSPDVVQTAQRLMQVATASTRFQVTVLVDSTREGVVKSSKIGNMDAVLALVKKMFPKLEVAVFSLTESSFVEQAAIFKRTALLLTPYGIAAGSTILLPRGSSVIEIFPFMFRSEATISTARSAGVSYFKWENDDVTKSTYDEDCLTKNGFQSLTVSECRRHRPCLFCVRDHVSTIVDRKELKAVLTKASVAAKTFLEANNKNGGLGSWR